MFHHFHGSGHPTGQGSIDAAQFVRLIEHLGRERFLGADEFRERAVSGTLDDSDLCITFDDGLCCQLDVALPMLENLGLTAFWFVNTAMLDGERPSLEIYRYFRSTAFASVEEFYADFFAAIGARAEETQLRGAQSAFRASEYLAEYAYYSDDDRWFRYLRDLVLDADEYGAVMGELMDARGFDVDRIADRLWLSDRALASLEAGGHVIGLHSHSHPTRMDLLEPELQEHEYVANLARLAEALAVRPTTMSHPCGFYNAATLELLGRLGIELGFRADMNAGASLLEIPREDHSLLMRELR